MNQIIGIIQQYGGSVNNLLKDKFGYNPHPMLQYINLFKTGKWLNTYELPFLKNTYLQSSEYDKWSTGSINQVLRK